MRDIVNPLIKTYYDALTGNVPNPAGGDPIKFYEGEEPDDLLDKMYGVITNVNYSDASTKSSTDVSAQIQITINSWEFKYNNSKNLNTVAGTVLELIKPTPNAVLDMSEHDMQMLNLNVQNDVVQDYGKLANRVFISRNIIFQQDIFLY